MLRYLPFVIEFALLVYCLIDCIQTDSVLVRNLSKTTWVFVIILIPIAGAVAWLVAGRPSSAQRRPQVPWPATATAGFPEYERPRPPKGPDDDPSFLADLRASDAEHERMLKQWEEQLRDRERQLEAGAEQAPAAGDGAVADPGSDPEAERSGS